MCPKNRCILDMDRKLHICFNTFRFGFSAITGPAIRRKTKAEISERPSLGAGSKAAIKIGSEVRLLTLTASQSKAEHRVILVGISIKRG